MPIAYAIRNRVQNNKFFIKHERIIVKKCEYKAIMHQFEKKSHVFELFFVTLHLYMRAYFFTERLSRKCLAAKIQ